ncbi:MAG: Uma2 family endonuclease [Polyangia bacterium]
MLPRGEHSESQAQIVGALIRYSRGPGGADRPGGWRLATEPTIELSPHEVVQPDAAGWRRERMPNRISGYPVSIVPDWVCEIMCDGDARRRDSILKRRIYADHGVPFYWLVDTERETLTVFDAHHPRLCRDSHCLARGPRMCCSVRPHRAASRRPLRG